MNDKPKCVIVTGRPGAGKTTLAKKLGQQLWMPVISRDEIKEGYVNTFGVNHEQLPGNANAIVFDIFLDIVFRYLAHNVSIVIEAAFQHKVWARTMPQIIEISAPYLVICSVEGMTAAQRHLQRGLDDPNREFYHGDKRVSIYRETGVIAPPAEYAPPAFDVPTLFVSTEGGYDPSLDEIARWIQSSDSA